MLSKADIAESVDIATDKKVMFSDIFQFKTGK